MPGSSHHSTSVAHQPRQRTSTIAPPASSSAAPVLNESPDIQRGTGHVSPSAAEASQRRWGQGTVQITLQPCRKNLARIDYSVA
jgi:hypothetical protein